MQAGGPARELRSGARATRTSWRLRREMTRSLWAVLARVHLGSSKSANAHREQWMRKAGQDAEGQCLTQMKKSHTLGWERRASHFGAMVNANCSSLGNFNWHYPPEHQEIGKARAQRLVKEGLLALG